MITAKEVYDKAKEKQAKFKDDAKAFAINEVETYLEAATLIALDKGENCQTYEWHYEIFEEANVSYNHFLTEIKHILEDLGYKVKTEVWSNRVSVTWDWSEFIDE